MLVEQHVGERTARALAQAFGSIENLQSATLPQLTSIRDVGLVVAQSVYSFFKSEANLQILRRLHELGVVPETAAMRAGGRLSGKNFVFTGTLNRLNRTEARKMVEDLGGNVLGSVSGKTDYLVSGEEAGSKLEKARALGVQILDEAAFAVMIYESGIEER